MKKSGDHRGQRDSSSRDHGCVDHHHPSSRCGNVSLWIKVVHTIKVTAKFACKFTAEHHYFQVWSGIFPDSQEYAAWITEKDYKASSGKLQSSDNVGTALRRCSAAPLLSH